MLSGAIAVVFSGETRSLTIILEGMLSDPWTVVTFIDLYLGFLITAAVIMLAERGWALRLFWAAPIFILGNVWAAVWIILRFSALRDRLRVSETSA